MRKECEEAIKNLEEDILECKFPKFQRDLFEYAFDKGFRIGYEKAITNYVCFTNTEEEIDQLLGIKKEDAQ